MRIILTIIYVVWENRYAFAKRGNFGIQTEVAVVPELAPACGKGTRRTVKPIVVSPSTLLANVTPPCMPATALTIARPRPCPCN